MVVATNIGNCTKCIAPDSYEMLICRKCTASIHYHCAQFTIGEAHLIKHYYCEDCRSSFELVIHWNSKELSEEEKLDKEKNYYDVVSIKDHRITSDIREFLIQWKNLGDQVFEDSWQPEDHLDGCVDLLNDYLLKHKLPLTTQASKFGLDPTASGVRSNPNNWTTLEETIKLARRLIQKHYPESKVNIDVWNGQLTSNSIYFIGLNYHLYVAYYISPTEPCYVADGTNHCEQLPRTRNFLKRMLNHRIITCTVKEPVNIDHCATGAILIALDFIKNKKHNIKLFNISYSPYMKNIISTQLHKYPSASTLTIPLNKRSSEIVCPNCDKSLGFTKKKKNWASRRNLHIQYCTKTQLP